MFIRIFNGRRVRIENSVKRITVWHHEAWRVMPNHYPLWQNFNSNPTTITDSFILFFLQLHFRLEYVIFYQSYLKITFFGSEMFGSAPLLYNDVETFGGNWHENEFKTSKLSYRRHAWELCYTPSCKTTIPSPGRVHGNCGRVCKPFLSNELFYPYELDKYIWVDAQSYQSLLDAQVILLVLLCCGSFVIKEESGLFESHYPDTGSTSPRSTL